MSDFIERLRKWDRALQPVPPEKLLKEAADEIDRLESENERLKWAAEGQGLEYEKLFLENERLEARVADLEGALRDATDAIKTLPPDIFGDVITDEMKWPIRDELIHKCRKALKD